MSDFTSDEVQLLKRWAALGESGLTAKVEEAVQSPEYQAAMNQVMAPLLKELEVAMLQTFEESDSADGKKIAALIWDDIKGKFSGFEQRLQRLEAEMFRRRG